VNIFLTNGEYSRQKYNHNPPNNKNNNMIKQYHFQACN